MAGKYALLIGASAFGDGGPPALTAPESDVTSLRTVLDDPQISGFDEIKFALNSGLEKTHELILWLFHEREADDLLLLYYTGHGFKDPIDGELYLALAGTREKTPSANSLLASWVKREIGRSASQRKLVILDCCHSGAIGALDATMKRGAAVAVDADSFSPSGYGSVTLASSSAAQPSFESAGRSIYTWLLVEALKTGAADPEAEEISAQALHNYLSRRVTEESRERGGLMEPVIYAAEKARLVIARNPSPRRQLDKKLVEDLWSEDAARVELAAIKLGEIMGDGDAQQAEDANQELRNRLQRSDDLSYAAGLRITRILEGTPEVDAPAAPNEEVNGPAAAQRETSSTKAAAPEAIEALETRNKDLSEELARLQKDFDQVRSQPEATPTTRRSDSLRRILNPYLLASLAALVLAVRIATLGADDWRALRQVLVGADGEAGVLEREDDPTTAQPKVLPLDCRACPEMVAIPAGSFLMGSPPDEDARDDDEGPRQEIHLSAFALARTEVTFDQWQACVDDDHCGGRVPPHERWGRGSRPVINVSWDDAQLYIDWLNSKIVGSAPYRLPSEAEWEYAARAGTETPFSTGATISTEQANFNGNYTYGGSAEGIFRARTVEVGDLDAANPWGLRHMHGNVREWTQDCWRDGLEGIPSDGTPRLAQQGGDCSRRVVRGGSWDLYPWYLRSANRSRNGPGAKSYYLGFRPARTLTP